jgi:putative colanic acid biosynthesis acetyltransferase WcaF
MTVDLSSYTSASFDRGRSPLLEALWLIVRGLLFEANPFGCYALKRLVLRWFGAKVGRGVIVKPRAKITFPWKLSIGDHSWLGEESWLHNLAPIIIEDNVCVSQRSFLCTGSHDYKSQSFNLITKPIVVRNGAWIAAGAWVGPGVEIGSHVVVTAGSVVTRNLAPYAIYQGNPAAFLRERTITR